MSTREVIQRRTPGRTRRPVLIKPADEVVQVLRANPGSKADTGSGWHLIATGDRSRLGVISQTSYRIRNQLIAAFVVGEDDPGEFETQVSTDTSVPGRTADVELYGRWVPAPSG
jgi:hypothetical protein